MNGWVIYNGNLSSDKFISFSTWIQHAGNKVGITIKIVKNDQILSIVDSTGLNLLQSIEQGHLPDFVLFIDKDIALARQLELIGIRVFNSADAIELCDNKVLMYQALAHKKLPIPKTIIAPKIFTGADTIAMENFYEIEKVLTYPLIIKEGYGSYGEQVYLIADRNQLVERIQLIYDRPFLFQEFIGSSYGRDVRINVVGNEVVAAVTRFAADDFRANVQLGSTMEAYQPSEVEKDLAIKATQAVGADFAGVDLLFGENGNPIICEVNTNAHIENIFHHTGVNVADHIVAFIKMQLSER
ncbi:ATP-grasp domain-containing protein [Paraliobacillus sediminis]|uniref:ATP-grasp domain-containing protein n=1 Tax=Paraliobacillus sediminis TaxID=1885916 RepID=UPI000E3E5F42|nr:RimK family alpha-L-glutamate ligase [Paraliobacillus sediminis]